MSFKIAEKFTKAICRNLLLKCV